MHAAARLTRPAPQGAGRLHGACLQSGPQQRTLLRGAPARQAYRCVFKVADRAKQLGWPVGAPPPAPAAAAACQLPATLPGCLSVPQAERPCWRIRGNHLQRCEQGWGKQSRADRCCSPQCRATRCCRQVGQNRLMLARLNPHVAAVHTCRRQRQGSSTGGGASSGSGKRERACGACTPLVDGTLAGFLKHAGAHTRVAEPTARAWAL